jgi:hypothetical protein
MMLTLDHLVIPSATLEEGVEAVEAALGVTLAAGGQHPGMGTHNRLLGLGDVYLEVIAVDPAAPQPGRPRMFDIDNFQGPPRVTNWVARCENLKLALAAAPPGTGVSLDLRRGDFRWRMSVPADGMLPFGGAFPALIEWEGTLHPTQALPDAGVRLLRFEIAHPEAAALRAALGVFADPRLVICDGPLAMRAEFSTPHGPRSLG